MIQIQSMTGYGESRSPIGPAGQQLTLICRVRSLNHRFLDLKLRLPRPDLMSLDMSIRQTVNKMFQRGSLEFNLSIERPAPSNTGAAASEDTVINHTVALAYLKAAQQLELLVQKTNPFQGSLPLSLDTVMRLPGVIRSEPLTGSLADDASFWASHEKEILSALVLPALQALTQSRSREGTQVLEHLLSLLNQLKKHHESILALREPERKKQQTQLLERIQETAKIFQSLSNAQPGDGFEARLREEAAFLLERRDFEEEVTRLDMHLKSMFEQINIDSASSTKRDESLGRRLEFIHQELVRETNTLGVKAQSSAISSHTIEMKTILDRLKEQLANVE